MREVVDRSGLRLLRDEQDHDDEDEQAAARVVAPSVAVRPCGKGAEKEEDQEDEEDCAHRKTFFRSGIDARLGRVCMDVCMEQGG